MKMTELQINRDKVGKKLEKVHPNGKDLPFPNPGKYIGKVQKGELNDKDSRSAV